MRWCALVIALAAGACQDPTVTIRLDWQPADLEQDVVTARVSVLELTDRDCAALRLGRVSADELEVGLRSEVTWRRTGATFTGSVPVTDIPRLGTKLFALDGRNADDVPIAGGCLELGDIDGDVDTQIVVEPAIQVRLIPFPPAVGDPDGVPPPSLELPTTSSLSVVSRERRHPGGEVSTATLEVFARTPTAEAKLVVDQVVGDDAVSLTLHDAGVPTVDGRPLVGAAELDIRGPWADEVVRVPAYVKPCELGQIALGNNQLAPSWTFGDDSGVFVGAAVTATSTGAEKIAVIGEQGKQVIKRIELDAPGARSVAIVQTSGGPVIVTRLATGWFRIGGNPLGLIPIVPAPPATEAADELIAMPRCANMPSIGVLARAGAGPYEGVDNPVDGGNGAAIRGIATQLGALQVANPTASMTVTAAVCITSTSTRPVAIATLHDGGVDRVVMVSPDGSTVTPFVGAVTSVRVAQAPGSATQIWTLVGAVPTSSGLRLGSYRLSANVGQFVPDGVIDHPLIGPPAAVRVFYANDGDDLPDSLAIVSYHGLSAIQLTFGGVEPVSSVALVPFGSQEPTLGSADLLEHVNPTDPEALKHLELVIAGRRGLVALDMTHPAVACGQ